MLNNSETIVRRKFPLQLVLHNKSKYNFLAKQCINSKIAIGYNQIMVSGMSWCLILENSVVVFNLFLTIAWSEQFVW